MNADCRSFQRLLELSLSGRDTRPLAELSWHEHLLGCADCRRVLEAEEALEMLLATLPRPKLPRELAARVVNRLRTALAQEGLDALLDLDAASPAPAGLARGLLERLASARGPQSTVEHEKSETSAPGKTLDHAASRARTPADRLLEPATAHARDAESAEALDARLEVLLDRARDVAVPDALAERVLAGLRFSRRRERLVPPWIYAAAAALVLALGVAWTLRARAVDETPRIVESDGAGEALPGSDGSLDALPEPELLAALDVLEQWDLLLHDDVDVLLSTLEPSEVDALDEAADEPPADAPATPPSNDTKPKGKG